jgi:cytochrome oxidase assembly protein ShyY1
VKSGRGGLLIPAAFTLCGLAILLALGTWQVQRKAWKEALIAALTDRLAAAPVELPPPMEWSGLTPESDEFRRVRLRADFREDGALVYTGGSALRDDVKSPGYFVFTAGRLPGGAHVVVNRGYVKDRTFPSQAGPAEIVGVLRWPETSSLFVTDHDAKADVWYVRNHLLMARERGWGDVAPFYIEQEAPVPPGGVPHPAPLRVNLPNHHLQYAITWYGLALALGAVFVAWLVHRRRQAERGTGAGS